MEYRVLIFMARERLAAIDIDSGGKTDTISLDGNDVMEYSSQVEIREFCQHIKNYYNIDAFSDLGMSIFILRFDAVMEDVSVLLKEIQEAAEYNLLSVEKVLPWIALKEGVLKAGTAIQLRTFDIVYTLGLDNELKMHCQIGGEREHSINLPKEKFAEYDHLSKNILFGDEEEKKELSKKYDIEIGNKDKQIKKLEKELLKEKDKAKATENEVKKVNTELDEIKEERERNANRLICRLKCANEKIDRKFSENHLESNLIGCLGIITSALGNKRYKFHYKKCCNNAEVVKKGQKIAVAEFYYCYENALLEKSGIDPWIRSSEEDFAITAKASGRLFWLQKPEAELTYGVDIVVIGDVSDTKEEVMRWYEKNK